MIVEATREDYEALVAGRAPRDFRLADTPIAASEILAMLAGVAEEVRKHHAPASWLIVEDGEVVGLCSITRVPAEGMIDIGYGIAPSRQRRGIASRAVADVAAWASAGRTVHVLTAETAPANVASQRVLERNGFVRAGERIDEEDGLLMLWKRP